MSNPAQIAAYIEPHLLGLRALELAQRDLGITEAPGNRGPHVRRILAPCVRDGRLLRLGEGHEWCAAQASAWAWEASTDDVYPRVALFWSDLADVRREHGYPPVGYRAAVSELVTDARATGTWRDVTAAEDPLPGDLLVFGRADQDPRRGGLGHVAICEARGMMFECISGNDGDEVRRRSWLPGEDPPWPWVGWIKL